MDKIRTYNFIQTHGAHCILIEKNNFGDQFDYFLIEL